MPMSILVIVFLSKGSVLLLCLLLCAHRGALGLHRAWLQLNIHRLMMWQMTAGSRVTCQKLDRRLRAQNSCLTPGGVIGNRTRNRPKKPGFYLL
ncbi:hypothetical protein LX36DRAFT_165850 [Colletotrichum falcatum]|nr:hypothetical protein LX36DRAFT_165850 [Colletotrichum falcatum]